MCPRYFKNQIKSLFKKIVDWLKQLKTIVDWLKQCMHVLEIIHWLIELFEKFSHLLDWLMTYFS